MMAGARAGDFDVVVVEALDRISRDQEDLAGIYKRLSFYGVEIHGVHDGKADQTQVGIRGLVGALYLEDLKHKVHRGMHGVVADGRHAGGRAYGYRPKLGYPGQLEIVETEAAIVRRIFEEYLSGLTPREIAKGLNNDRVPPPRGSLWSASTLNGNAARGHGILVNPIYRGRNVWNRVRMIKDPDTGRRVSRVNDSAKWVTAPAPHLAILTPEQFDAAQSRKANRSSGPHAKRRRPKHLFSGLLKCGCCGGGLSVKDRDHGRTRLICTRSKESGSCNNHRNFYLDEIERRIAAGLRRTLGSRAAIERFLKVYADERRRLAGSKVGMIEKLDRRLAAIDGELNRATSLLIKGILDEEKGAEQIRELKQERTSLLEERTAIENVEPDLTIHPGITNSYLASLENLEAALRGPEGPLEAEEFDALRNLVDKITVTPADAASATSIEVEGDLARLLAPSPTSSGGVVVAEEGFEPPTHGL